MRIVAGQYRGRHFDIPRTFKARPTTDFAKENLFNGYIDFDGCEALDLFAGTGSITCELLSRGCTEGVCVENDRSHFAFIKKCLQQLNTQSAHPLLTDVFRYVKQCKQQFDIIFADPPYALKELPALPDLILNRQLLKPESIFILEHGKDHTFKNHPNIIDHRQYGSVNFSFFRLKEERGERKEDSYQT